MLLEVQLYTKTVTVVFLNYTYVVYFVTTVKLFNYYIFTLRILFMFIKFPCIENKHNIYCVRCTYIVIMYRINTFITCCLLLK